MSQPKEYKVISQERHIVQIGTTYYQSVRRGVEILYACGTRRFIANSWYKFVLILILPMLSSCALFPENIEPEAQIYVDSFFNEAAERGIYLRRPNGLQVKFKNMNVQGKTNDVMNTIWIDRNSQAWNLEPEALIAHELGHLVLKRSHRNDLIGKRCASIMSETDDPVIESAEVREYYFDELFDPSTAAPENWN